MKNYDDRILTTKHGLYYAKLGEGLSMRMIISDDYHSVEEFLIKEDMAFEIQLEESHLRDYRDFVNKLEKKLKILKAKYDAL